MIYDYLFSFNFAYLFDQEYSYKTLLGVDFSSVPCPTPQPGTEPHLIQYRP